MSPASHTELSFTLSARGVSAVQQQHNVRSWEWFVAYEREEYGRDGLRIPQVTVASPWNGTCLPNARSVSLNVGYLVVKEGVEADSDGLLEIPQILKHTRAVPLFSNVTTNLEFETKQAATATTLKKASIELFQDSPLSHSSVLSEGTVDLDKTMAGPIEAQDTIRSGVPGNDPLTESVSSPLFLKAKADSKSQVKGSTNRTTTSYQPRDFVHFLNDPK